MGSEKGNGKADRKREQEKGREMIREKEKGKGGKEMAWKGKGIRYNLLGL